MLDAITEALPDALTLITLTAAIVVGALLGGLYFGGLWWTVRRMPRARHPLNLYFTSLGLRLAVTLVVFYALLTGYGWPQLVACLIGFFVVRLVLTRCFGGLSVEESESPAPKV